MNKEALIQVRERIQPYIHRTPVLSSRLINTLCGTRVYFKCENFQKTGSFKMRGASNAILSLSQAQKDKGVVVHSSGNFGQAISLAAKNAGIKACIVMPQDAAQVKKNAVADYGGEIVECPSTIQDREAAANRNGETFIHPSNDDAVILGQATAAMELLEDYPKLDYIFTPVGGGGLLAGTALAAKYFSNNCQVIAGEPINVDDAYRSLQSGKIELNTNTNTIADGLKTHLGDRNFSIIKAEIKKIIRVEEDEIIAAMKLIWEHMKIIIEPSSAVPFAALLKNKEDYKNKNVGIIISGGNVDLENLPF